MFVIIEEKRGIAEDTPNDLEHIFVRVHSVIVGFSKMLQNVYLQIADVACICSYTCTAGIEILILDHEFEAEGSRV